MITFPSLILRPRGRGEGWGVQVLKGGVHVSPPYLTVNVMLVTGKRMGMK